MDIQPVTAETLADFKRLMSCDVSSEKCRCMWFIKPVAKFHPDAASNNGKDFADLMKSEDRPLGLLAYDDAEPLGWRACGPRSRYVRAIRTPTYQGRESSEDQDVWLIPCLFVHPDARGRGLTYRLVAGAVDLAKASGAQAVEAFPYGVNIKQNKDTQVGFAQVFESAGFGVIRTPSKVRVVMRLDL
ncbi:MAG: GNAT family N-acetyltransferase [Rhodospirillales bacterium]|nr:GNAT family N-acetyltransferase [Rhodospirillales bacterium]